MKIKVCRSQVRLFGRAGESVTRGDRRKRELVFGSPFPPLTARPNKRREDVVGLTVGASPPGGAPKSHISHGKILTPVGHHFITHPARRFAPITVRQDWNAVRQKLEQVSDSVGIRRQIQLVHKLTQKTRRMIRRHPVCQCRWKKKLLSVVRSDWLGHAVFPGVQLYLVELKGLLDIVVSG